METHIVDPIIFLALPALPYNQTICISIGATVFKNGDYDFKLELIPPNGVEGFVINGALDFPKMTKQASTHLSIELTDYEFKQEGEYTFKAYINGVLLNTQSLNVYTVKEDGNV